LDDRLRRDLDSGRRSFGVGTRDIRPADARPLLRGTLADLARSGAKVAAKRGYGTKALVWIEDQSKMEVRVTEWDYFFGVTLFRDRQLSGEPLSLYENYSGLAASRLVDHSALGQRIQGDLKDNVLFIHIAIVGKTLHDKRPKKKLVIVKSGRTRFPARKGKKPCKIVRTFSFPRNGN
jgi:hypothetical protein